MTYPDYLMKSLLSIINHIASDIDNVPTKYRKVMEQRIDETTAHHLKY